MRRALAVLVLIPVLLTGCSASGDGDGQETSSSTTPEGFVEVTTDVGSVARPEEWEPSDRELVKDVVATFDIRADGAVVGQMDVMVNAVPPGSQADAVNAANQGARAVDFANLRHERRESIDVPGAESAYLNESTYSTDQGPARSLDVLAIDDSGDLMLVRISALESAYDPALVERVRESVRLETGTQS